MGSTFEMGNFVRDYISLKHIWDNIIMEKLGKMSAPGKRFHQAIPILWNSELREIQSDGDLMDLLVEFEENKVKHIHFNVEYMTLNAIHPEPNNKPNSKPNNEPHLEPNIKQGLEPNNPGQDPEPNNQPNQPISQSNQPTKPAYITIQPTQPAYICRLIND
ncbi:hypothetical protein ACOSQ4_010658 [Xanthoceras sorbifolium]